MVELPVYFSWSFTTGEDGNFESLARKLKPAVAPPGVGRRRVDATHPWPPACARRADDPGAEIVVEGPVVSPQKPEDCARGALAERGGPALGRTSVTEELVDEAQPAPTSRRTRPTRGAAAGRPAACTARTTRGSRGIETEEPAASSQPQWFRELNIDPRNRIVGGLGTRVVQAEQEDLMAAAWNQVIGVEAANRALRLAQLAKHVSRLAAPRAPQAPRRRRRSSRSPSASTPRSSTRRSAASGRRSSESSLPASVTTGAFRRLTRVRGPVVRAAVKARHATPARRRRADRPRPTGSRPTGCCTYANPDGIGGAR